MCCLGPNHNGWFKTIADGINKPFSLNFNILELRATFQKFLTDWMDTFLVNVLIKCQIKKEGLMNKLWIQATTNWKSCMSMQKILMMIYEI